MIVNASAFYGTGKKRPTNLHIKNRHVLLANNRECRMLQPWRLLRGGALLTATTLLKKHVNKLVTLRSHRLPHPLKSRGHAWFVKKRLDNGFMTRKKQLCFKLFLSNQSLIKI